MRLLHKASLVFLLKDVYSKYPVISAVILCNGKQNPYTRKNDGYYVFSNLNPGNYDIEISCKGYTDIKFLTELKENETKIMNFDMSYTSDNVNLSHVKRFDMTLKNKEQSFNDTEVTLELKNAASFLKLIEPAEAGAQEVKLNMEEMIVGIIGQKYIYKFEDKETEIYLLGYDEEKKCYTLQDPLQEKLDPSGSFYPAWNVRTDSLGKIIMPFIGQFMKDDEITIKCKAQDFEGEAVFNIKEMSQSGKVFYADVEMNKITSESQNV